MGWGEMTVRYDDRDAHHETDLSMRMGAIGTYGQLLEAGTSGIDLAVKTDALWVRTESDGVDADAANGGNLAAAEADVTRLRLILEGSRAFDAGGGATFTPSAEVGLRHDAGDAETGTGLELGGGFTFAGNGFQVAANARMLAAHEESGYEEWGASVSVRMDPGEAGRGLSLTIAPTWGATGSQTDTLYALEHTGGLARDGDFEAERRLETEVGYGLRAPYGQGTLTPYSSLTLGDGGHRTERVGARWQLAPDAALGVEGTRERGATESGHALMVRAQIHF